MAAIVSIALIGPGVELILDGESEAAMLKKTDDKLRQLPEGVLVTWYGGGFDLPFIDQRAKINGVEIGLTIEAAPDDFGSEVTYRGRWHHHSHLDGYRVYSSDVRRTLAFSSDSKGFPCGLKSLAHFVGLPVVEVDRNLIHTLDSDTRRSYVASDANLARQLVDRRPNADAWIDQLSSMSLPDQNPGSGCGTWPVA